MEKIVIGSREISEVAPAAPDQPVRTKTSAARSSVGPRSDEPVGACTAPSLPDHVGGTSGDARFAATNPFCVAVVSFHASDHQWNIHIDRRGAGGVVRTFACDRQRQLE